MLCRRFAPLRNDKDCCLRQPPRNGRDGDEIASAACGGLAMTKGRPSATVRLGESDKSRTKSLLQDKDKIKKLLDFEKSSCPFCESKRVVKAGQRLTRQGRIQKYLYKSCRRYFCSSPLLHKSYRPQVILNAITTYNFAPLERIL